MLKEFILTQFIHNNIFLGNLKLNTSINAHCYLLGYRNLINLIKLSKSILHCKQNYEFLSYFFSKYGSLWLILIITFFPKQYKKYMINIFKTNIFPLKKYKFRLHFYAFKWRPGILTNYSYFRLNKKQIPQKKKDKLFIWYPSGIFQFNIVWNIKLQYEPSKVKTVGLNISDPFIGAYNQNYIIPGNEKMLLSLLFYLKMFINFITHIFLLKKISFNY